MALDERLDGLRSNQRQISVEDQNFLRLRTRAGFRRLQKLYDTLHADRRRVARTPLIVLFGPGNTAVLKNLSDLLLAISNHHHALRAASGLHRFKNISKQRLSEHRMEHLRGVRDHARALTGGKYDRTNHGEQILQLPRNERTRRPQRSATE